MSSSSSSRPDTEPSPGASVPRRYGGSSAQERLQQRRERLLEASLDVFGRHGYANSTMRLICANARMTDRYFYECFGSLDEVFRAVHEQLSAELGMQIAASMPTVPTDPIAVVRGALKVFFEYIKADPRRARILLLDAMMLGLTNPNVSESRARRYADLIRLRLNARYKRLPEGLDVELIASGFLGHAIHTASVWTQRNFDTPVERMVEHTVYAWMGLHQWLASCDQPEAP